MQICWGALLAVRVGCGAAWGEAADVTLTAEQAATARRVEEQLMAPCCFGSTVGTHHSPAADAIRNDVRARVAQGANEQQILDSYLDRYGERILAQPVARGFNLLAYWMPVAGWVCGTGIVVLWLLRRRRTGVADAGVANQAAASAAARSLQHRLEEELAAFDL